MDRPNAPIPQQSNADVANPNDAYINLTRASKLAPGNPSANSVWRWCRKGVRSRGGERIRLQHVRAGSTIYTTATWVHAFIHTLADADTKFFATCDAVTQADGEAFLNRRRRRPISKSRQQRQAELEQIERDLDQAGL